MNFQSWPKDWTNSSKRWSSPEVHCRCPSLGSRVYCHRLAHWSELRDPNSWEIRVHLWPYFSTACRSFWSSSSLHGPVLRPPRTLLNQRLRQSLFVRFASFAAIRCQSLIGPSEACLIASSWRMASSSSVQRLGCLGPCTASMASWSA